MRRGSNDTLYLVNVVLCTALSRTANLTNWQVAERIRTRTTYQHISCELINSTCSVQRIEGDRGKKTSICFSESQKNFQAAKQKPCCIYYLYGTKARKKSMKRKEEKKKKYDLCLSLRYCCCVETIFHLAAAAAGFLNATAAFVMHAPHTTR